HEYQKTFIEIEYGLWSDDGSQILALLDALMRSDGRYNESLFLANLLAWMHAGKFQAGGLVFDIGGQTRYALEQRESGQDPAWALGSGRCGNGSLMRVLPAAVLPDMFGISEEDALVTGMRQSDLTHSQAIARVCCAVYVETCWAMLQQPKAALPELVAG